MKMYLDDKNLWSVLEKGVVDDASDQSKNDGLAFHIIWISCENEAADLISDLSSSKEAWDRLADEYGSGVCF